MPSTKKPATKPKGKAQAKPKAKPKAAAKGKHAGGRPPFVFDLGKVKGLAQIQCTNAEICAVLGCGIATLERHLKADPAFAEAIEQGRNGGKASLRRMQYASANAGNATMQIWLGKQLLGQKDRQDVVQQNPDGTPIVPASGPSVVVYIPDNGRDNRGGQ